MDGFDAIWERIEFIESWYKTETEIERVLQTRPEVRFWDWSIYLRQMQLQAMDGHITEAKA